MMPGDERRIVADKYGARMVEVRTIEAQLIDELARCLTEYRSLWHRQQSGGFFEMGWVKGDVVADTDAVLERVRGWRG